MMELVNKGAYSSEELPDVGDQVTLSNVLAYGPDQTLEVLCSEVFELVGPFNIVGFTLLDNGTGQEVSGVSVILK